MAIAQLTGANLASTALDKRNGVAMLVGHRVSVCSMTSRGRSSSVILVHSEFVNSLYLGALVPIVSGRGPPLSIVRHNISSFLNPISSIGSLHIVEAQ